MSLLSNPFVILGFFVIVGVVVYFVMSSQPTKTPQKSSCNPDEEITPEGCVKKCPIGQVRCNGKTCYDPSSTGQYACLPDIGLCDKTTSYCPNDPKKCCDPSERCIENKCQPCPSGASICDGKCCAEGESCQKIGSSSVCCLDKNYCLASGTTDEKVCCQQDCCNGICCGTDESCISGKCLTKCGSLPPCDPDTEDCFVDSRDPNNIKYGCIKKSGCNWGTVNYNPQLLEIDDGSANPPQYPVCKRSDGTFWLTPSASSDDPWAAGSNTVYTKTTDINNPNCTPQSCDYKISNNSVHKISLSEYDSPNIKVDTCSANLDCNIYLHDNIANLKTIANDANIKRPYTFCVTGSDQHPTGQICLGNTDCRTGICMCNENDANSKPMRGPNCEYTVDGTCSGHGTPQDNGICICDGEDKLNNIQNFDSKGIYKWNGTTCVPLKWYEFYDCKRVKDYIYGWLGSNISLRGTGTTVQNYLSNSYNIGWASLIVLRVNIQGNGNHLITNWSDATSGPWANKLPIYYDWGVNDGQFSLIYNQFPGTEMYIYNMDPTVRQVKCVVDNYNVIGVQWDSDPTSTTLLPETCSWIGNNGYLIASGGFIPGVSSNCKVADTGDCPVLLSAAPAIFVFNDATVDTLLP